MNIALTINVHSTVNVMGVKFDWSTPDWQLGKY